jgi:VWFA-related protein
MAIVFTGGRSQDAQDFTSNKRLLLRSVDRFMGQKLDSATANRNNEFFRQQGAPQELRDARVNDPEEMQRAQNARNTLRTLQRVSEWFGSVRGRRKSLLYFSEGVDYDISDIIRGPNQTSSQVPMIIDAVRETLTATARANVSIYSIDPRGLTDGADDAIAIGDFANNTDPRAGIGMSSLRNEIFQAQQTLRSLSEESGGFALVNRNNVAASFDRIVEENSSYYLLAYYPTGDKRPGRFHRIEVKVNKPGLTVRSRRGYMTARPRQDTRRAGTMPQPLFDALNSPMQVSGVTLKTFVAPFKGTEPNASVLIGLEMAGRDLTLEGNSKVDITVMAIDVNGKTFGGTTDTLTLNFRPESRARVEQTGIRTLHRLELPPGRYQVRAAVRDAAKNVAGSVIQDLEVPSFYKESLSMSGLALTSLGAPAMMIPKQDEQLRAVLPAPPVGQRVFQNNDEIALFAEVYDRTSNNPHKVEITTSVLTDEGRSLFKTEDVRDSSELQGAKGGYGITARIPLSDIPAGRYVLSVEARSRVGNNPSVVRQIQFEVRAAAPRPPAN